MEIEIDLNKSVEQNASFYYEKAKRARLKSERVKEAIRNTEKKLRGIVKEKDKVLAELAEKEKKHRLMRKKEWYEKFHWFFSSEGFLCIGGRDATSNEIVVKKHAEKNDLVLHAEISGSPFFIIKNGQEAGRQTIDETAQAVASYSRAWKEGLSTTEVFYVKPEQVTKKAKSGEFMPKGAFMIYGETKHVSPAIEIAVGAIGEGRAIGGPVDSIRAQAEKYVVIVPGKDKTSDIAKKIKKILSTDDLDEIISFIPAGGCAIRK